ncbi:multifunctional CCA addition/repair protein [uncultured Methylibium sp.]|uniref:multifunctional CCA addition/repair protein n=1 Tax=uncultured Methylibium sp. TaxID=381093 RepID=UPI0025FB288D|nr:multifunctional CCA addition/repair protein [uncultured Methylibium sp.]
MPAGAAVYEVGGAVRDALLGLAVRDRDWVVVGSTPDAMRAAGFLPVGRDFPVFLHPATHEEYALARSERKTGPGYHGFAFHAAPDVTLEQDLARRDLTINAIARRDDGTLVDPHGGRRDLAARVLRHVSPAFAEDPVRILRLARFAARFSDFAIAPETLSLMRAMVEAGEVDALVPERVWQELARGLLEARPSRMFEVLQGSGALQRLLPELAVLRAGPGTARDAWAGLMAVLDAAAGLGAPITVRYACLGHALGVSALHEIGERLRVPNDCRELAQVVAREHDAVDRCGELDASGLLRLLERCDALRKPQRFAELLQACECAARAGPATSDRPYAPAARLLAALGVAQEVDTAQVAAQAAARGATGPAIGDAIHAARVAAIGAARLPR